MRNTLVVSRDPVRLPLFAKIRLTFFVVLQYLIEPQISEGKVRKTIMKTIFAKKGDVERKWYVVDAKDAVLGRLATKIATYIRGKNKPVFN